MSLLSKIAKKAKGIITKGSKYLPALAAVAPNSKALANAAQALQTGSQIASVFGGGMPALPSPGAMPVSMQAGNFPSFPALPGGGGGGIVKTGFPLVAAAGAAGTALVRAAPAVIAGGRALLAKVSPKVAKALGWATVGGLVYDAAGNVMGQVKRRQMNPLNPRAARRAVRRIKSVRKLCANIERTLPKSKARKRC